MQKHFHMGAAASLLFFGTTLAARAADNPPPISPAISKALDELSASDFATREQAMQNLQKALGEQLAGLLRVNDPEAENRMQELLEFQGGLTRWAMETIKLTKDQRDAAIAFGLKPEVLPIIAELYSDKPLTRRDGVRELGKLKDDQVGNLIAKMIDDQDRAVYMAAMEVAYDQKPSDALVDALWFRAVDAGFAVNQVRPAQQERIDFRGRNLGMEVVGDQAIYLKSQDNNIATEVLVHLQAPQVDAKLVALMQRVEQVYGTAHGINGGGDDQNLWMYVGTQENMKNAMALMEISKSHELVPPLYRIATGKVWQESNGQVNAKQQYYWSNRTWAMALFYKLTDRRPDDAGITRQSVLGNIWATGSKVQEENIAKQITEWWTTNGAKYEKK